MPAPLLWQPVKANNQPSLKQVVLDSDVISVDTRAFEKEAVEKGYTLLAGTDEAGRGPLAGPVVAAAVILPPGYIDAHITDSKKLTQKKRDLLYDHIYDRAVSISIAIIDAVEIDRINILQASLSAMTLAVHHLDPKPDFILIDGIFPTFSNLPQKPIPQGDLKSISISAASIVAKVTRDRLMLRYHDEYPEFGFADHKGYPTSFHREAIKKFGCCPIHRRSFKGVKEHADPQSELWKKM